METTVETTKIHVEDRRRVRFLDTFFRFLRNPAGSISFIILLIYVVIAVVAPYIAPYPPDRINLSQTFLPPSSEHLFGTGYFGRDTFSRVLFAIRIDLEIAFISVSLSYVAGLVIGIYAGYVGRISDNVLMRIMDVLLAFPSIILAIAIGIAIGPGFWTIIIAITVVSIPTFSRIARSVVLSTKNDLYVLASKSLGGSRWHILLRHILPQAISPTIVIYSLTLGAAIIIASSLSFLGVGIPPPTPELGAMVATGYTYLQNGDWWSSTIPGLFIVIIVIAFNMMGETIREVTDVTLRR
ncbi:MAG: ABC transporter permease [Thermoplasmataceae archaeon]